MKALLRIGFSAYLLFTLSACGSSLAQLAENTLYPFEQVNKKYQVPEVAPDDLRDEHFTLAASDGSEMKIHGWSYWSPNPTAKTLVFFHGNGENLQALYTVNFINALKQRLNAHFIIIDYPGLGRSTGKPNQANLISAGLAAVEWALTVHPQTKIIVWGRSLGAAVAAQVAEQTQHEIAGVILTSPWNTFLDAAKSLNGLASGIPADWLRANEYDSAHAATQIHLRASVQHGTKDELIPFKLGKIVFESFPDRDKTEFVELQDKGHNDIFQDPTLWQNVRSFLR